MKRVAVPLSLVVGDRSILLSFLERKLLIDVKINPSTEH